MAKRKITKSGRVVVGLAVVVLVAFNGARLYYGRGEVPRGVMVGFLTAVVIVVVGLVLTADRTPRQKGDHEA